MKNALILLEMLLLLALFIIGGILGNYPETRVVGIIIAIISIILGIINAKRGDLNE